MPSTPPPDTPSAARTGQLLFAGAIAVALVGYAIGTRAGTPTPVRTGMPPVHLRPSVTSPAPRIDPDRPVIPATAWAELPGADLGPGRGHRSTLADLTVPVPGPGPTTSPSAAQRRVALASRAATRAFNGAPPVIPHAVDATSAAACLACHGSGLAIGDLQANRIPHETLANCLQCHVEQGPDIAAAPVSLFRGLPAPEGGRRAWTGAPPQVPHSTLMRHDCLSCHGSAARFGMRTTHPERASCLQCHAPSADLDQMPVLAGVAQ